MKENIINKLREYIRENNPDLLMQLEEDVKITEYLSDKVNTINALIDQQDKKRSAYIIEEVCMDVLAQDLRSSKFNYLSSILQEEFENTYLQLQKSGTLKFEIINLIKECQPVFNDLNFSEANEDNQFLRYAIVGTISEYLEKATSE